MAIDSSPEKLADEAQVFIPEEWEEAADVVAYDSITCPPPICVICGPPNSGKTTFSRHLLNVLIHRYTLTIIPISMRLDIFLKLYV